MRKRYIIVGLLASSLAVFGQRADRLYTKKKLRQTDIQILLSYYTQDNDHSAVTGGIGTENLQVYAAQFSGDWGNDSTTTYHIDGGLDVISSASTDNIDFVKSSASKVDYRGHINLGANHKIKDTGFTYGITGALSAESDYLSRMIGLSLAHRNEELDRELSISFQTFFDDLRWGRFDNGQPQILIYPAELRSTKWFSDYNRNSFNLSVGYSLAINARTRIGIYPGVMYQTGLLSTPFHRVYFNDNSKRVENLPDKRLKFPIGLQLNKFIGSRLILRSYYRFYLDNYSIQGHTIDLEAPVKTGMTFTIIPFVRFYQQSQSNYFAPYKEHDVSSEYYTSDYDLSNFTSYKAGVGFKFTPIAHAGKQRYREFEIRYSFYKRSDGMAAHMITTFIDLKYEKYVRRR